MSRPFADPRTRRRAPLSSFGRDETLAPSNLVIPFAVLSLRVIALATCKEWLLERHYGSTWVVTRALPASVVVIAAWWLAVNRRLPRVDPITAIIPSVTFFLQHWCLLAALQRLPLPIVLAFSHAATSWVTSLASTSSPKKTIYTTLALTISVLAAAYTPTTRDPDPTIRSVAPAFLGLLLHAGASLLHQRYVEVLSHELRSTTFALALSGAGAAVLALPFGLLTAIFPSPLQLPSLPATSLLPIPLLALSMIFPPTFPSTPHTSHLPQIQSIPTSLSFISESLFAAIISLAAFGHWPGFITMGVGALMYYALMAPVSKDTSSLVSPKQLHGYYDTVMSNPESRKIAYFLALNLAYMGVQITYGIWTNSLGLISDAIHMFFDCMAIAMGLFASVMATWPPNERFTYGYGRAETLSGFANGIFLILISIFIVFEAIQRIIDPPEMNTNQLLLVSSMGLGVNLFGMFAMGGHHHHGHSHGHGHDHGHGHSHGHDHSHDHEHDHEHGHSHSHDPHHHDHAHKHEHKHEHPEHVHSSDCDHEHDHAHADHSHSNGNGNGHGNGHAHHHHDEAECHSPHEHHDHDHSHPVHHHHEHPHSHEHEHDHDHKIGNGHSHPHSEEHHHDDHHSHSHSTPPIVIHTHLDPHDHGHSHSHNGHAHEDHGHEHTHNHNHSSPPSLLSPESDPKSPITPSYSFVLDAHAEEYHPHSHSHDHSHGHDHGHGGHDHDHGHSHNMRGVFLHVMADTLGSVGVIASTLLIQWYGWTGFDPIASLFIASLIVASVVPLVIDTGRVLSLDLGGEEDVVWRALSELSHVDGVKGYAHPRFWPKDAETMIGSITVLLSRSSHDETALQVPIAEVVRNVEESLRRRIPSLHEVAIQAE